VYFVCACCRVIYPTYELTVKWVAPLDHSVWITRNAKCLPVEFSVLTVPVQYTAFSLGWHYFFFSSSLMIFIAYTVALATAGRDDDSSEASAGRRRCCARRWTLEQRWVWSLSLLLPLFNDPLFAATIFSPTFSGSVFSALSTVTFLTALLVYFLVHFNVAALQGEGGANWSAEHPSAAAAFGVVFWAPKFVFGTAFWIVALSAYLWTRYQQVTDPAYSLFEQLSAIGDYFYGFLYTLAALYLIYLAALLFRGFRVFGRMRAANRVFVGVTLSTVLILIVGIYLDVFSPLRTGSAAYLVVYGAANFYVWLLIFAYLPDRRATLNDVILAESSSALELPPPDTTGVLGGKADAEADDADLVAVAADVVAGASAPPRRAAASLAAPRAVDDDDEDDGEAEADEGPTAGAAPALTRRQQLLQMQALAAEAAADAAAFALEDEEQEGSGTPPPPPGVAEPPPPPPPPRPAPAKVAAAAAAKKKGVSFSPASDAPEHNFSP